MAEAEQLQIQPLCFHPVQRTGWSAFCNGFLLPYHYTHESNTEKAASHCHPAIALRLPSIPEKANWNLHIRSHSSPSNIQLCPLTAPYHHFYKEKQYQATDVLYLFHFFRHVSIRYLQHLFYMGTALSHSDQTPQKSWLSHLSSSLHLSGCQ